MTARTPSPRPRRTHEDEARRLHALVQPLAMVSYRADEPTEALLKLGLDGYWEGYFAGRAAPLGTAPASLVHAVFYNFTVAEVEARIPQVWRVVTPAAALQAREEGATAAVRRIVGALADTPEVTAAADLALQAALSGPTEGRPLYAALRAVPLPEDPIARLWHAATLLREHRGDSHNALLVASGISGLEAHVLKALSLGQRPEEFGRITISAVSPDPAIANLAERGLVTPEGAFTPEGRALRDTIEAETDHLTWATYGALASAERDRLSAALTPVAAALVAVGIE